MQSKKKEHNILTSIQEGYGLPDVYFQLDVKKATTIKSIPTVLNLQYLTGRRFHDFYVKTDEVRDADTLTCLEQMLKDPLTPYGKFLFSGFTGSGKTTEIIKLCFQLQEDFNVIIFSAWSRLKIEELTLESLIFEIVEDILKYLESNDLLPENKPDNALQSILGAITDWCKETKIIEESGKEVDKSKSLGIDFFKGFFFKLKTGKRSYDTDKVESTRLEERKINDLIFECNKLFDYLRDKTGKGTLVIVDDLEKMSFMKAKEFYSRNASFIRDMDCKMVLTIPVELIYHPDYAIIQNVFGEAEVLPMIKIKDINGESHQAGIDCLSEILQRRLDFSLFQNECYKEAIKYSGGAIRQLFRIIQRAALIETSNIITEKSLQKSISYHKDIFASRIQERDDEIEIKFEEYLKILFDIYDGNKITPQKNSALLDLLRTRAVMKYNGKGFYDTHPLLDDFIKAYKEKMEKNGKEKPGV